MTPLSLHTVWPETHLKDSADLMVQIHSRHLSLASCPSSSVRLVFYLSAMLTCQHPILWGIPNGKQIHPMPPRASTTSERDCAPGRGSPAWSFPGELSRTGLQDS